MLRLVFLPGGHVKRGWARARRPRDEPIPLKNGNVKEEKGGEKMKKIMGIFAAIIISLAVIGFSYATWYSSVYINGYATLGTIDLRHYSFGVYNQTSPAATITPVYSDADHTLTLTMGPVYPGWKAFMGVNLINNGNLPLKFYSFQMIYVSDATLAGYFNLGFCMPIPPSYPYNVYADFNYFGTLRTYEGDWGIPAASITLAPGAIQYSLISIDVNSNIPSSYQGSTLTVTFQLQATLAV
jgi:hypothetical protein